MKSQMYPNLGSALRNANAESALFRRWFPGAGQRGGGFAGMGEEICDPVTGICFDNGVTPVPSPTPGSLIDPSLIYADPGYNITTAPLPCPDGSAPFADGSCAETTAPAGSAGNAAALAQIAAAVARGVAPTTSAIGGGVVCPAGYAYGAPGASVQIAPGVATVGTGKCLPVTGGVTPAGQWFSFATNQQVTTFGIVVLGVIVFVNLIPSGGGRRRR